MKLMAITAPREDLVAALALCGTVINRRNIIPIYANVKIEADEGDESVKLTASDLEITVVTHAKATATNPGGTTIDQKALYDALKSLDADEVRIEVETNESVTVTCGTATLSLPARKVEDYPTQHTVTPKAHVTFNAEEIKPILRASCYATSSEEVRYQLAGVLLRIERKSVDIVAMDGHRMARHVLATRSDSEWAAFLPTKAIGVIEKLTGDELTFEIEDNLIRVIGENGAMTARLQDINFPEYRKVVQQHDKRLTADRERLLSMVRRASSFADGKTRGLVFGIDKGRVTLRSRSAERGAVEEYMAVDYAGDAVLIGLTSDYVADALAAINTSQVAILFGTPQQQVQFIPEPPMTTGDALHIVMPMQL